MRPLRRRIDVDGHVFRVISSPHARADAPAIVLIHGIGMSHRYFSRLHRVLQTRAHVISVDLPGFAGLPTPSENLDVPQMSGLLARVLTSATEHPVIVVGHSMGAQWAIDLAVQHPELARLVVVIGPVADDAHRTIGAQAVGLALDTVLESALANAIVFTDYVRTGIGWYLRQVRPMLAYAPEERVPDLRAPLLVIRGSRDPIAGRAWSRRLRAHASDAVLVEVPGRGHVVQHSAPRAVAAAIIAHVPHAPSEGPEPSR